MRGRARYGRVVVVPRSGVYVPVLVYGRVKLPSGGAYLPDFRLDGRLWVEVKPSSAYNAILGPAAINKAMLRLMDPRDGMVDERLDGDHERRLSGPSARRHRDAVLRQCHAAAGKEQEQRDRAVQQRPEGPVPASRVAAAPRADCLEGSLCGKHAAFHRRMAALDPRGVEEARVVADQAAAGEGQLRDRLEPERTHSLESACQAKDVVAVWVIERGTHVLGDGAIVAGHLRRLVRPRSLHGGDPLRTGVRDRRPVHLPAQHLEAACFARTD